MRLSGFVFSKIRDQKKPSQAEMEERRQPVSLSTTKEKGSLDLDQDPPKEQHFSNSLKPLLAQPYISDNPFRLLGISSASPQTKLRPQAQRLVQAVRVGLTEQIALSTMFGTEDGERVTDIVKKIANDAKSRTTYRIMWPLNYEKPPTPLGTLSDFDGLITKSEGTVYGQQALFLQEWFLFLHDKDIRSLRQALSIYASLYNAEQIDIVLTDLLEEEGELNTSDICSEALAEITQYLLNSSVSVAVENWESDNWEYGIDILKALREINFDEAFVRDAAESIISVGNRERSRLEEIWRKYKGWKPGWNTGWQPSNKDQDLNVANKLFQLTTILKDMFPSQTHLWIETVEEYSDTIGSSMRAYAIHVANERDDYSEALSLVELILNAPISGEFRKCLTTDANTLKQSIQARATKKRNDIVGALFGYALLGGFIGILALSGRDNSANTSPPLLSTSSSGEMVPSPSQYTIESPATPDPAAQQKLDRRNNLVQEANSLKSEIDASKTIIDDETGTISRERENLNTSENRLTSEHAELDRSDEAAVTAYNTHVGKYEEARHIFNRVVNSHNEKVRHNNALVRRYNEINQALREMGN